MSGLRRLFLALGRLLPGRPAEGPPTPPRESSPPGAGLDSPPAESGPVTEADLPAASSAPVLPADAPAVPERYTLVQKLGEGGMGVVYKARDERLERFVALKFLPHPLESDPDARARFLQEARAAAQLNHPAITTLHGIEDAAEPPFLVMEFVPGETLEARLARSGALPVDEAAAVAVRIAEGLEAAHDAGVVHRDVKPANVMLTPSGAVKIMDFGIARREEAPGLTREGSTVGSASYMSPEQAMGEAVDARTDLWSLGVVLYEMLAGRLPFPGPTAHAAVHQLLTSNPAPLREVRPDVPPRLAEVVERLLRKDRTARPGSAAEVLATLREEAGAGGSVAGRGWSWGRRVAVLVPAAGLLLLPALWFQQREAAAHRARTEGIPALLTLVDATRCLDALHEITELERVIPGDPQLVDARERCARMGSVLSDPAGARAHIRPYGALDREWHFLGTTPVEEVPIPIGMLEWRIEKEGYAPVEHALHNWFSEVFEVSLVPASEAPEGMVRVPGGSAASRALQAELGPYWLDRFEVTNEEYMSFVEAGGYRDRDLWRQPFEEGGRELSWEEAMGRFTDPTGMTGPSAWRLGSFPEGQGRHPVDGVSWYEAEAYCRWKGKELPTMLHWRFAAGGDLYSDILHFSNFDGRGPSPVGAYGGMSRYGAYDMAGNVKEWVWNAHPGGRRHILGGSWSEPDYLFRDDDARPPLERLEGFGFRCALYETPAPEESRRPSDPYPRPEIPAPVPDEVFEVFARTYDYLPLPLAARVESVDESSPYWRFEIVSFAAAYGDERVPAHLYLPKNAEPPYQAVIYYPGGSALDLPTSGTADRVLSSFVVRSGRALVIPVYKGTHERRFETDPRGNLPIVRELIIRGTMDLRRTVDYLESRDDIDSGRIAFMGQSLGALLGPIMTAMEPRLSASVLSAGGLWVILPAPEISPHNFAPRVRVPTLMIGGRQDFMQPYETHQVPSFELLGVSPEDKALRTFEGGHVIPMNDLIRETNAWLDRYLGRVGR